MVNFLTVMVYTQIFQKFDGWMIGAKFVFYFNHLKEKKKPFGLLAGGSFLEFSEPQFHTGLKWPRSETFGLYLGPS